MENDIWGKIKQALEDQNTYKQNELNAIDDKYSMYQEPASYYPARSSMIPSEGYSVAGEDVGQPQSYKDNMRRYQLQNELRRYAELLRANRSK